MQLLFITLQSIAYADVINDYNEMFKLALANASRHVLLRSKVYIMFITKVFCTSCQ